MQKNDSNIFISIPLQEFKNKLISFPDFNNIPRFQIDSTPKKIPNSLDLTNSSIYYLVDEITKNEKPKIISKPAFPSIFPTKHSKSTKSKTSDVLQKPKHQNKNDKKESIDRFSKRFPDLKINPSLNHKNNTFLNILKTNNFSDKTKNIFEDLKIQTKPCFKDNHQSELKLQTDHIKSNPLNIGSFTTRNAPNKITFETKPKLEEHFNFMSTKDHLYNHQHSFLTKTNPNEQNLSFINNCTKNESKSQKTINSSQKIKKQDETHNSSQKTLDDQIRTAYEALLKKEREKTTKINQENVLLADKLKKADGLVAELDTRLQKYEQIIMNNSLTNSFVNKLQTKVRNLEESLIKTEFDLQNKRLLFIEKEKTFEEKLNVFEVQKSKLIIENERLINKLAESENNSDVKSNIYEKSPIHKKFMKGLISLENLILSSVQKDKKFKYSMTSRSNFSSVQFPSEYQENQQPEEQLKKINKNTDLEKIFMKEKNGSNIGLRNNFENKNLISKDLKNAKIDEKLTRKKLEKDFFKSSNFEKKSLKNEFSQLTIIQKESLSNKNKFFADKNDGKVFSDSFSCKSNLSQFVPNKKEIESIGNEYYNNFDVDRKSIKKIEKGNILKGFGNKFGSESLRRLSNAK